MAHERRLGLAVAQVGGINLSDTRSGVVSRLIEMMREAKARGASVVVYPELTLTTFFPRHWVEDDDELDQFFERQMPNEHVQPLFDCAKQLRVGFYLGYAELTPDHRRFNTSILVDPRGRIVGKYRKVHLPGHADHKPDEPAQHLEKRYFEVGDLGFGVFEFMRCKAGMCICNDRRWPEVYRVLALQSADLVLLGYNTPSRVVCALRRGRGASCDRGRRGGNGRYRSGHGRRVPTVGLQFRRASPAAELSADRRPCWPWRATPSFDLGRDCPRSGDGPPARQLVAINRVASTLRELASFLPD